MKWIENKAGDTHVEISPREARQGRLGKPELYVLIAVIVGSAIAVGIAAFVIG